MAMGQFADKDQASLYAKYRPTYPESVFSTILGYTKENMGNNYHLDLAVDVGCGSGQSTLPLCTACNNVIGYDVSACQIEHAPRDIENLTFKVGPAEDLSFLGDGSTDLITCAQALHWFDREKFYPEVRRVLKPGGVFAAYGYGISILDHPDAQMANMQFYDEFVHPYLHEKSMLCYNHYRDIGRPFENTELIENEGLSIHQKMPVDAYIGFLASASSWRKYLEINPNTDVLQKLKDRYDKIYDGGCIGVRWPVFILIGRNPI